MATDSKKYFVCAECSKKTSTTDAKRAKVKLCAACAPDLTPPPAKVKKSANACSVVAPAKRRRVAKPATPVVETVAAPAIVVPPVTEARPVAVPSAEVAALDQQIAEIREAMNRLASDLSAKRI
jgi:hypothetical protein